VERDTAERGRGKSAALHASMRVNMNVIKEYLLPEKGKHNVKVYRLIMFFHGLILRDSDGRVT
jgi:hypothetical protein